MFVKFKEAMPGRSDMLSYSQVFGAAVALIVYKLYKLFAVPNELKHIPPISLSKTLLSLVKGEPFDVRFGNTIKPALEQQGVARVWVQGKWELVVSDYCHVKEILARVDKYLKRRPGDEELNQLLFRKTLGASNILVSDGADWRRHRRIANPAFKASWSPDMFYQGTKKLAELIEASPEEAFQVHDLFRRLTLDLLGKGLLSYNFEAIVNGNDDPKMQLYEEVVKAIFNPIYFTFPFLENWVPSRKASHLRSQEFRDFLKNLITERKSNLNPDYTDLLTLMIKGSKDAQYTEDDVINDLAVFFFAGHDTTANSLTTMFYYLAKHPEIQERARKEINVLLNFEKRAPTHKELKEMAYVDCIIKESMRIMSTVPQIRRYCLDGDELSDGLVVPKNTFVNMNLWEVHHNERTYPKPYSFNPDRFLDLHNEQNTQWMAFGGGSRMCIGKSFSLLEQRVAVAMLLQTFSIHLGPEVQKLDTPKLSCIGLLHLVGVDLVFKPIA